MMHSSGKPRWMTTKDRWSPRSVSSTASRAGENSQRYIFILCSNRRDLQKKTWKKSSTVGTHHCGCSRRAQATRLKFKYAIINYRRHSIGFQHNFGWLSTQFHKSRQLLLGQLRSCMDKTSQKYIMNFPSCFSHQTSSSNLLLTPKTTNVPSNMCPDSA